MLLLLESRPIYNDAVYQSVLNTVLGMYYRDIAGHETSFRPIFFLNDVLRYWKTLLLNYEHKRHATFADEEAKAKHRLNNFKLGFSRLLICFSTAIALTSKSSTSREEALRLVRLTPLERLHSVVSQSHTEAVSLLQRVEEDYGWFLQEVQDPTRIRALLCDDDYKHDADNRGEQFASSMYQLLASTAAPDMLRYVVI